MSEELVGVAEVAKLLGVTRTRVVQLAKVDDFPEPIARLAAGPVWTRSAVLEWARATGRLTDDA